jgi:hypothetical protein
MKTATLKEDSIDAMAFSRASRPARLELALQIVRARLELLLSLLLNGQRTVS